MKLQILLADKGTQNPHAGTLNLLNVGWHQTSIAPGPPGMAITPPHAVAIFWEVDPQYCNKPIELVVSLVTEDGNPVELPGPAGPQPMELHQQITVVTPAGMPMGTPGVGNMILEIQPGLPLQPGGYEWRVSLAGQHEDGWSASFRVAHGPPQQGYFGVPPTT